MFSSKAIFDAYSVDFSKYFSGKLNSSSAFTILVFISMEALLVKVMAMILEKRVKSFSSVINKQIYSLTKLYVFPLPADAFKIFNGLVSIVDMQLN